VVEYQFSGLYPGEEIFTPSIPMMDDSFIIQPSYKTIAPSGMWDNGTLSTFGKDTSTCAYAGVQNWQNSVENTNTNRGADKLLSCM
jgi:hypothetical protein